MHFVLLSGISDKPASYQGMDPSSMEHRTRYSQTKEDLLFSLVTKSKVVKFVLHLFFVGQILLKMAV